MHVSRVFDSFILTVLIFFFCVVSVSAMTCSDGRAATTVFYVNGFGNTPFDAQVSATALSSALNGYLPQNPPTIGCVNGEIRVAYNYNEVLIQRFLESARQYLSDNTAAFWRIWANVDSAPDWFQQLALDMANSIDKGSYIIDADLREHVAKYRAQLASGNKVALVSHSQGNFYANEAHRVIYPGEVPLQTQSLGIVAVATPASFVAGDGLVATHYTTQHGDLIWRIPGALRANVDDPCGDDEWWCHSFTGTYLAEGATSRERILMQVVERISGLQDPGGPGIVRSVEIVSLSNDGQQIPGGTGTAISPDGRFVVFNALVDCRPDCTNGASGFVGVVFVRDRLAGRTEIASVSTDGALGNQGVQTFSGGSSGGDISGAGRFVTFGSASTNLIPDDRNGRGDAFVRDRETGVTTRVSVASGGSELSSGGGSGGISPDGRFVGFNSGGQVYLHDRETSVTELISVGTHGGSLIGGSRAVSNSGRFVVFISNADLVGGKRNGLFGEDVYVRDRLTQVTTRVSVNSVGVAGNGRCCRGSTPVISGDGRFVAFDSDATDLVDGDTNGIGDSFVHDRLTGSTERVSVASDGSQAELSTANSLSFGTALSDDGRFVVFTSDARNLVEVSTPFIYNVFLRDRAAGKTFLVSARPDGTPANGGSGVIGISADGRFVLLGSSATNLVAEDTNGSDGDTFVVELIR